MSIVVDNLSHKINDRWVFRDLSFQVAPGEVFGVLGANGSGKSLLLKFIAGLENPLSGGVEVCGSNDPKSASRNTALVTGDSKPKLTSIFRGSEARDSAHRLAKLLDIIRSKTPCVLLDSVLDGFDTGNMQMALSAVKERSQSRSGCTVVAGTERRQIYTFCDRVGVLHEGDFIQVGSPEEIYRSPANTAVARLTGYINAIEVRRLTSSKKEDPEFMTLKGDHRLSVGKTEKSDLAPINQTTLLAIRPEDISISFGASFPEDNLLKATVTDVRFLGPVTKIWLDSNGLALEAVVLRLVGLHVGDECVVALPPGRLKVLKG